MSEKDILLENSLAENFGLFCVEDESELHVNSGGFKCSCFLSAYIEGPCNCYSGGKSNDCTCQAGGNVSIPIGPGY